MKVELKLKDKIPEFGYQDRENFNLRRSSENQKSLENDR